MLYVCVCLLQVLASLAQEPQEFAQNLEVLDSIVKIYTVFARCATHRFLACDAAARAAHWGVVLHADFGASSSAVSKQCDWRS